MAANVYKLLHATGKSLAVDINQRTASMVCLCWEGGPFPSTLGGLEFIAFEMVL